MNETEETVSKAIEDHQVDMQKRIRNVMLTRLKEWQAKYPKRSVAFMDAMGATMIHVTRTVDDPCDAGEYDIDDWHPKAARDSSRLVEIFRPLNDARDWYLEVSDQTNVGIRDILIGEPFWPIHIKDSGHFELDPREYDK